MDSKDAASPPKQHVVPPSTRGSRWEFLDACRGIAALLVLLQHAAEGNPAVFRFTSEFFNLGEIGVVAFFLVSGYIIPVSLERYGAVGRFWIGRAFRLLPAYWCNFAVLVLLMAVQGSIDHAFRSSPARYVVGNMFMAQGLARTHYGLLVYWTLSFESIFYILCSVLFALGQQRRSVLWAQLAAGLFLASNLCAGLLFHRAVSAEKFGILVTALIGTLIYRYSVEKAKPSDLLVALALMAPGVVVANWLRLSVYWVPGDRLLVTAFSGDMSFLLGYLLFGVLFWLRARQFPRVLLWLGNISYSVYLWHALVLRFLPAGLATGWRVLVTLGSTLLLATLSYRFVEQPALALQRRLFPHGSPAGGDGQQTPLPAVFRPLHAGGD